MKNRYKIKEEWGMGQYRLEGISVREDLDARFTMVERVISFNKFK